MVHSIYNKQHTVWYHYSGKSPGGKSSGGGRGRKDGGGSGGAKGGKYTAHKKPDIYGNKFNVRINASMPNDACCDLLPICTQNAPVNVAESVTVGSEQLFACLSLWDNWTREKHKKEGNGLLKEQ